MQDLVKVHKSLMGDVQDSILYKNALNLYQIFISYKERYPRKHPCTFMVWLQGNYASCNCSGSSVSLIGLNVHYITVLTIYCQYIGRSCLTKPGLQYSYTFDLYIQHGHVALRVNAVFIFYFKF